MTNVKRTIRIAISLLIIGGAGSLATFFTMDRSPIQESANVDAAAITAMEVRLDNGRIRMLETDDANIRAELTGEQRNKSDVRLRVEEANGTLKIETARTPRTTFGFFSKVRNLQMTVYVPKKTFDSLKADIENGSIEADRLQASRIEASASNARIEMEQIAADSVNVRSNNGSIVMKHVAGEIFGETENGKITVIAEDLDRSMDLHANNGSIKIETGKEPTSAVIDVRAHNGKVNWFGKDDWNAVVGKGDHLIKPRTNSGNITAERLPKE